MSFFEELKRRNVIRVGIAYVVIAWLIAQVADLALGNFEAPGWVIKTILLVLALGLPVAVFFAWAFELTPEGIKKESDVDRRESITPKTGRKLDRVIIGVLVLAVAYFAVDKFLLRSSDRAPVAHQAETTAPAALQTETTAPAEATAPTEKSIAVLPFVNMSADPDNEYFADGLSEELLNQLAQIPELMVVGRTSSFSFKGKNEDLRSIGTTLGVAHVLEGSVRRQAEKVRITTQLIRVSDGFHLWSETYDRTLENVFAIQDDIAASVARALRLVLDDEARNAMQAVGVRNVDAFVAYQKGYDLYQKAHGDAPTLATLAEAHREFERAIELVPEFGAAWWTMTDYYAHVLVDQKFSRDEREQALTDLRIVLDAAKKHTKDPTRRAFIALEQVLFSDDWTTLVDRIEAMLSAPGCPTPVWTELIQILGYGEALAPMWERSMRCEPLSFIGWGNRGSADILSGKLQSGLDYILAARSRFGVHPSISHWHQRALLGLGRFEEAAALAPEIIEEPDFYGWSAEVMPLAAQGKIDEARAALARWKQSYGDAGDLAGAAVLGDREEANRLAAQLDAEPAGPFLVLITAHECFCGSPFDLDATPNFKARLKEAGIEWNPRSIIDFPAKDW